MAAIPGEAPQATSGVARPPLRIAPSTTGAASDSVLDRAWARLRLLVADYAVLGVLDLRRAAVQLAWLVGAGIVIAVLVVSAWMAGVTALIAYLLAREVSWPLALIVAGVVNLIGAALAGWRLKSVLSDVPFAATLRQLKAEPPPPEDAK
ncbi:MAG: phage holin family protein [Rhodospirillaceae bacterium]